MGVRSFHRKSVPTSVESIQLSLNSALQVSKCFNDVYRTFNPQQYPIVVADFRLPTDAYDVNVEPNKRTVFLHREQQLIDTLRVPCRLSAHRSFRC